MEGTSCSSNKVPCDFAEENRNRLEEGRVQFNKIDGNIESIKKGISSHEELTYTEAKETQRQIGCLEGKIRSTHALILEIIRGTHGDRYANALAENINPSIDSKKLAELRKQEELLKQEGRNLNQKLINKLKKLTIVLISIGLVAGGSYLVYIMSAL